MKIFAVFHALCREYKPLKMSINGSVDLYTNPSFDDIACRLTRYYDRLHSYNITRDVNPYLDFSITRTNNSNIKITKPEVSEI